jgi:hypothetical protein
VVGEGLERQACGDGGGEDGMVREEGQPTLLGGVHWKDQGKAEPRWGTKDSGEPQCGERGLWPVLLCFKRRSVSEPGDLKVIQREGLAMWPGGYLRRVFGWPEVFAAGEDRL